MNNAIGNVATPSSKNTLALVSITTNLDNGFQIQDSAGQHFQLDRYDIHHLINDSLSPLEGRMLAFEAGRKLAFDEVKEIEVVKKLLEEVTLS